MLATHETSSRLEELHASRDWTNTRNCKNNKNKLYQTHENYKLEMKDITDDKNKRQDQYYY